MLFRKGNVNATQLVNNAILQATGELYTGSVGDDDWKKMLMFANFFITNWANEPSVDWISLYEPKINCGIISATDTFSLDPSISKISNQGDDYVQITQLDGQVVNYQTIPPNELKRRTNGNFCSQIGSDLVFNKAFVASDPQIGGTLTVPSYAAPSLLVAPTDMVVVDDPNWLVLMCAAKWVQTDVTLAQNYPQFIAEANEVMQHMQLANRSQVNTIPLGTVARGIEW